MRGARGREALAAAIVGAIAFLPFLRGALSGASLYFRDLALYFLPLRRLALDGLLSGELRFWNPYLHEGVPLSLPALGYPLDLLQLLRPDEVGISVVLALHVPLAAASFYVLARHLVQTPPSAAAGGALVYALGGFVLSTVNLYVYLEAAAWAPLVVLALGRTLATGGSPRSIAGAALAVGIALSTTGVEIVVQAVAAGLVLGLRLRETRTARGLGAAAGSLALGVLLAAPVLVTLVTQVGGSARSQGFATDVVLAHSVHPFTLLQAVVAGLYGNLSNLAGEWWGQNFFPRGFPYILSLYVGPAALALALVGAATRHPLRWRLVLLTLGALVVSLGRWSGLAAVVETFPAVAAFRYPVKAFFTVHLVLALLVARGLSPPSSGGPRHHWTSLVIATGACGGLLALAPLLPHLLPEATGAFARAFFPPGLALPTRLGLLQRVLGDAATGGAMALALAGVAALARRGTLASPRATLLAVAIVGADLLRAGSGLNPMVAGSFYRPSPELAARLDVLRGGRVFTCSFDESRSYREARIGMGAAHEVWTFAVALETLTPAFNVPLGVPAALSPDLTMLVPMERVLSPADATCRDLDAILPRLRRAGVHTIISADPLAHPALEPRDVLSPRRVAPLRVHLYRLASPLPRVDLLEPARAGAVEPMAAPGRVAGRHFASDRIEVEIDAPAPGMLLIRDGWAEGWRARVDGEPAPVERAGGGHRAVPVPAGRSLVTMRYRPPGLVSSLLVSLGALAVVLGLLRRRLPGGRPRKPTTA